MRIELIERDENLHIGPTRSGEWIDVSKMADGSVSFTSLCKDIEDGVAFDASRWLVRPAGRTVALWHNSFVWTTDASPNARVLLGRHYAPLGQDAFDRMSTDATLQAHLAEAEQDSSYKVMTDERREQIAQDYDLWLEYVDPAGVLSQDDFDAMSVDERIQMMNEVFPNG